MKKITREQYLTPDPNIPAPRVTPRLFTPTRPARGDRELGPRSSKSSARAALNINGFAEGAESHLELTAGLWLLAQPDIVDVISQAPQVEFIGIDGKLHTFTFDYLSIHQDGTKTAHSVRPLIRSSELEETHRQLQTQMSPEVANRINLITEEKLRPEDRFNAALIYTARRFPIPEHDHAIERIVAGLIGSTTIGELCRGSGLGGSAFRSIVRLISARKLELVSHSYIISSARVRRGEALGGAANA